METDEIKTLESEIEQITHDVIDCRYKIKHKKNYVSREQLLIWRRQIRHLYETLKKKQSKLEAAKLSRTQSRVH